jgi:hypothetical protein
MISTLNEKPLHAALKDWYARPSDRLEVPVDRYVVDIVRDDLLIEIQTQNVSGIRHKLADLAAEHALRLVIPVPREKWIVKVTADGETVVSRRKSPKRGSLTDVFDELVSIPHLLTTRRFSVEVLLTQEEEVRRPDSRRGWRRGGWVVQERRLLGVVGRSLLTAPQDVAALVPPDLAAPFTTQDLAQAMGIRRRLAQRMAYCLRKTGGLTVVGKEGRSILYAHAPDAGAADHAGVA